MLNTLIMKKLFLLCLALCLPVLLFAQLKVPLQRKVEMNTMKSSVLNVKRNYSVYLPKIYATSPDKKYPNLYLLHGMNDNNKEWGNTWTFTQ